MGYTLLSVPHGPAADWSGVATRKTPKKTPPSKKQKPAPSPKGVVPKRKRRAPDPARRARNVRIAQAVVEGTPKPVIAASEGVHRCTVYRALHSDDCRQVGMALVNRRIGL